jgi:hypothetical protein
MDPDPEPEHCWVVSLCALCRGTPGLAAAAAVPEQLPLHEPPGGSRHQGRTQGCRPAQHGQASQRGARQAAPNPSP